MLLFLKMSDQSMSDASSDELNFNNMTTSEQFQERLRKAQAMDESLQDGIVCF